jgi:branched-chain amino acid transport system substrate-binding protein
VKSCSHVPRRLLLAAALAVLSLVAIGCGGAAGGGGESAKGPVKVGVLTTLSGPQALPGQDVLDGIKLYVKQHPKLAGRDIKLIVKDDGGDPQQGIAGVRELLNRDRVDLVAGIVNSAVLNAVKAPVLAKKVPLVVAVAGSEDFTKPGDPDAFRSGASNGQANRVVGWYAYDKLGMRKVAVIALDYVAGAEHSAGFKDVFTSLGGKVVAVEKPPLGTPDFGPYISRIPKDVDGVYVFTAGADAVKFWKQAASFGLTKRTKIIGSFGAADTLVLHAVGGAADGFIAAGGYVDTLPSAANQQFQSAYRQSAGRPGSVYAESAYAGMEAIGTALKATDGKLGAGFSQALGKVSFAAPAGPFRFDANRQAVVTAYVYKVVGGKPKVIDQIPNVDQGWQPKG